MAEIVQNLDGQLEGRMLSLAEYADKHGVATRTVKTWLSGKGVYSLPGAVKDATGAWRIPEHAVRQMNARPADEMQPQDHSQAALQLVPGGQQPGGQMMPWGPPEAPEPSLREDLDDEPGYLSVADASRYLGIPQAQILANVERFGLEPVGINGSLRVPQRVVRRIMGY